MNSSFLSALKESGKGSISATAIFFAGVLVSAYLLFTLPHRLIMEGGLPTLELAWPVLVSLFITVSATLLTGMAAINFALRNRRETLVYIEKKKDESSAAAAHDENGVEGLPDAAEFRKALQLLKVDGDYVQEGLNILCQKLHAGQGAIYQKISHNGVRAVELKYGFALAVSDSGAPRFDLGEGLVGQAAASGKSVYLDEIPEGYIQIVSGLGTASPRYVIIAPMKAGKEIKGVVEIATFAPAAESQRKRVEELAEILAEKLK